MAKIGLTVLFSSNMFSNRVNHTRQAWTCSCHEMRPQSWHRCPQLPNLVVATCCTSQLPAALMYMWCRCRLRTPLLCRTSTWDEHSVAANVQLLRLNCSMQDIWRIAAQNLMLLSDGSTAHLSASSNSANIAANCVYPWHIHLRKPRLCSISCCNERIWHRKRLLEYRCKQKTVSDNRDDQWRLNTPAKCTLALTDCSKKSVDWHPRLSRKCLARRLHCHHSLI